MELLNRYLHSVRQYLPEAQQDDIIRELAENIRSQQEDQEAALGRPLREDEVETMLKRLGHPMAVAGHYLPRKHLIGPVVFPYYWYTLKGTLWVALMVYIVAACTTPFVAELVAASSKTPVPELLRSPSFGLLFWGGIVALIAVFGIVTVAFAVIDLLQARYHLVEKWDPRQLMPVPQVPPEFLGRPISRPRAIARLVVGGVFTLCWLTIPQFPMILGPGAGAAIQPAAEWPTFRLFLLALVLVSTGSAALGLIRPHWMRWLWPVIHCASVAGLFWVFWLARSGNMVAAAAVTAPGVDPQFVARVVNAAIAYGVLLALCCTTLNYAVGITRHLTRYIRAHSATAAIHLANL